MHSLGLRAMTAAAGSSQRKAKVALQLLEVLGFGLVATMLTTPVSAQQAGRGQNSGAGAAAMPGMPDGPGSQATISSPADQTMMEGMARMERSMNAAPSTGDPDRDFVAMMIPHHVGAVDMARVELRYGKDVTLRRMARAIVATQEKEVWEMKNWMEHRAHS